jgi:alpha-tubulin suppressor-like RCC1 family protein
LKLLIEKTASISLILLGLYQHLLYTLPAISVNQYNSQVMKKLLLLVVSCAISLAAHADCWTSIGTNRSVYIAIKGDSTLWSWGVNNPDMLGDSSKYVVDTPRQVGTAHNWKQVSVGWTHVMAVQGDGTLWAWGSNWFGEYGNGTKAGSKVPIQIGSDTNWACVSAGRNYTLAIKTNGSLWGWGFGVSGNLGIGTANDTTLPVQVGTSTNWTQIATGSYKSMGIQKDSSLWCWGYLGGSYNNHSNYTYPVRIGNAGWKNVHISTGHILGVQSNGTLWGMGENGAGQLGIASPNRTDTFLQIGTASSWQIAAGGQNNSIGIQTNGTAWSFGYSNYGALGLGSTTSTTTPTQIGTSNNWSTVNTYNSSVIALKADSSLWVWGEKIAASGSLSVPTYIPVPLSKGQSMPCLPNATSVSNLAAQTISFYPNPAKDQLTVEAPAFTRISSIILTDLSGRTFHMDTGTTAGSTTHLDISSLSPGMYFLVVYSGSGRFQQRFIKE